jgi:DNA segregation ATPase FtsK/SpoIIIE, S-DNA-T family
VQKLQAPIPPVAAPPIPIPWIAALTPVMLALVMSLIFQQVLALMMGLIGPAMVLGSWWESRRQATRAHARSQEEFAVAHAQHAQDSSDLRAREKTRALALLPPLLDAAGQPLWRRSALLAHGCRIGLGFAQFPEGHALRGSEGMPGMPCVLDPTQSVTLVGDESCRGIWRTIAVSWVLSGSSTLRVDSHGELPRQVSGLSDALWVGTLEEVPDHCSVVIVCRDKPTVDVRASGMHSFSTIPDRLSSAEALWILRRHRAIEKDADHGVEHDVGSRNQLWCSLSEASPTWDLVREGPHVVVWGATGSGKSVTVSSLVRSLAERYPPESLVCVLIDFKGGAGLRSLQDLPHTIGSITDMEGAGVSRALVGLHSELLRRERILHEHEVADISEVDASVSLPRLVVVIDEAAWLLTNFPEFQSALSDVLARGRSLGVHVIISTQRVTGVLPQAMMANVSLRICGRVVDDTDALSWIPDLSPHLRERVRHLRPGEVICAGASAKPALHEVASTREPAPGGVPSPWRVWADPLPAEVDLTVESWGLVDDVPAQVHRPLRSADAPAGSCLILGDSGSGKSTALGTLAGLRPHARRAPTHPLLLWLWWRQGGADHPSVLLDDVDHTLALAGPDGAHVLMELLQNFSGTMLISAKPDSLHQRALSRMCGTSIVLPVEKVEEREALHGLGSSIPGRARYQGETIQIARGPAPPEEPEWVRLEPGASSWVITRSPESWAGAPVTVVLSPEELARKWHEVPAHVDIILDRVSPLDVRGATLGRIHPPPLPVPDGVLLVWRRDRFDLATRAWWKE